MSLVCIMMNWKETSPSVCEVQSVVHFLTVENNSEAEVHCYLLRREYNTPEKCSAMAGDVLRSEIKHT